MRKSTLVAPGAIAGLVIVKAFVHGDVTPQSVETAGPGSLGAELRDTNHPRGDETALRIGASALLQNCAQRRTTSGFGPPLAGLAVSRHGGSRRRIVHQPLRRRLRAKRGCQDARALHSAIYQHCKPYFWREGGSPVGGDVVLHVPHDKCAEAANDRVALFAPC